MLSHAFVAAALLSVVSAKVCKNVTVPVQINARQGVFNAPIIEDNLDAVKFGLNFTKQGSNFTDIALTGYQTVDFPANISARICRPDNDTALACDVQVLSHGIGFDKSYWDLPYNDYSNSYTDVAISQGYCTVAIDRYGIGNSSHGEPLNQVQAPAEVSALYGVTQKLRNGTFPSVNKSFDRVFHVGHSFGSAQTYLLSALHPEASDGIALTGFSMNATWLSRTLADWNLHVANLNQPLRFGNDSLPQSHFSKRWFGQGLVQALQFGAQLLGLDYTSFQIWQEIATSEVGDIINGWNATVPPVPQNLPDGYLTWTDLTSNIYAFLYPPYFDLGFAVFAEMTKQPVTSGEIHTLASGAPATNPFTGPVLVFTGEQDNIYCGGDCLNTGGAGPSIPYVSVHPAFANASNFEAYIQPNTGHGINFHHNATAGYQVIQNFFESNSS